MNVNLSRIFAVLMSLIVGMTFMGSVTGAYYLYVEVPYLSYTKLPFPVLTKTVKAGERVLLTVLRCSADNKTRVYNISHLLMPEDRKLRPVVLDATAASIEPGCTEAISSVNQVPVGTAPGRYHVEGLAEVNGTIRTFSVGWRSEPFTVVP